MKQEKKETTNIRLNAVATEIVENLCANSNLSKNRMVNNLVINSNKLNSSLCNITVARKYLNIVENIELIEDEKIKDLLKKGMDDLCQSLL